MSLLPRVAELTRERVCREFDNLGPEVCVAEITEILRRDNPEILDMAARCAADSAESGLMVGFAMFYRLLTAQSPHVLALPRVSAQTRRHIAQSIDERGGERFTRAAIADLEHGNPELLQMAHRFSERRHDYLASMQGFALLYVSLAAQAAADRAVLH